MEQILSQIDVLTPNELSDLIDILQERRKKFPIDVVMLEKYAGKFDIYYANTQNADDGYSSDIEDDEQLSVMDNIESYTLIWKDSGQKISIKLGNQFSTMFAGTTSYEIQVLRVGPFVVETSFPRDCDLPRSYTGIEELHEILLEQGIEGDILEFVKWILTNVVKGSILYLLSYIDDLNSVEAID